MRTLGGRRIAVVAGASIAMVLSGCGASGGDAAKTTSSTVASTTGPERSTTAVAPPTITAPRPTTTAPPPTTTAPPTTAAPTTTAPPPTTIPVPTTAEDLVNAFVRAYYRGDRATMERLASPGAIASFNPPRPPDTAWTIEGCPEVAQGWACNVHLYEDLPDHTATIGWYEAHVVPDDAGLRLEHMSPSV